MKMKNVWRYLKLQKNSKSRRKLKRVRRYIEKSQLQKNIITHLENGELNQEESAILEWLKHNTIHVFPYNFTKKYLTSNIEIFFDHVLNRKYVVLYNKKMYLPKNMKDTAIKKYISSIMLEQDHMSPHRYLIEKERLIDKIVADIGAAEGNFALSIIDYAKKIYIFECDPEWIEALQLTFKSYISNKEEESKVVIVRKFIGDTVNNTHTTLDEYFRNKQIDYIKADIEGSEVPMLKCGKATLMNKVSNVILCSYHRESDEKDIKDLLEEYGYKYYTSNGYMIFPLDKSIDKPYLRRALIYGNRVTGNLKRPSGTRLIRKTSICPISLKK